MKGTKNVGPLRMLPRTRWEAIQLSFFNEMVPRVHFPPLFPGCYIDAKAIEEDGRLFFLGTEHGPFKRQSQQVSFFYVCSRQTMTSTTSSIFY
jgi:hypothetical protein